MCMVADGLKLVAPSYAELATHGFVFLRLRRKLPNASIAFCHSDKEDD